MHKLHICYHCLQEIVIHSAVACLVSPERGRTVVFFKDRDNDRKRRVTAKSDTELLHKLAKTTSVKISQFYICHNIM